MRGRKERQHDNQVYLDLLETKNRVWIIAHLVICNFQAASFSSGSGLPGFFLMNSCTLAMFVAATVTLLLGDLLF